MRPSRARRPFSATRRPHHHLDVPSSSFPSFPSAAHRFGDRDQPEPLVPEVSHEPARPRVVLRLPELFPPQSGFFEKNVRGGKRVKVVKVVVFQSRRRRQSRRRQSRSY